jgi:uroporphyrinogen decarboxylase
VNGKERILTALSVEEPDRVPLYIHAINEQPIIGIGKHLTTGLPEPKQFHEMNDAEKGKLLDTLFLIHEAFSVDGMTSFEIGHEAQLDERRVQDDWGVISYRSPHGIPVAKEHPIPDTAALERYSRPERKREHLLLLDLARERFKGEIALFWMMRGIFVRSWRLVGMENLMIKMATDPDFVHRVAEIVLDYNLKQLDMLVEAGIDVLIVEDDIATTKAPLISLEYFKRFVNPYNRQLVERGHELGLKVIRHSDGNLWQLMDVLLDTGYDGLNPLEPQADMDLKRVKQYCGDRMCLLGNIDCQELLPDGTPEQVEAAVQQAIDDAGEGGGLVICSSNSLHPGVNPENCIAMFQATKQYGAYVTKEQA